VRSLHSAATVVRSQAVPRSTPTAIRFNSNAPPTLLSSLQQSSPSIGGSAPSTAFSAPPLFSVQSAAATVGHFAAKMPPTVIQGPSVIQVGGGGPQPPPPIQRAPIEELDEDYDDL
jgi:hypothetical protein